MQVAFIGSMFPKTHNFHLPFYQPLIRNSKTLDATKLRDINYYKMAKLKVF